MAYVKASGETVLQWPYRLKDFSTEFPQVSTTREPSAETLARFDIYPIFLTTRPEGDVVNEVQPVKENGEWVQTWSSRDFNPLEIEMRKQALVIQQQKAAAEIANRVLLPQQMVEKLPGLTDEELASVAYLYPEWAEDGDEVAIDGLQRFAGVLYICEQAHTPQAGWEPPNVPALWSRYRDPVAAPQPWEQLIPPDVYNTGDRVTHDNPNDSSNIWIYESAINANTTQPGRDGTFDRWWTPIALA